MHKSTEAPTHTYQHNSGEAPRALTFVEPERVSDPLQEGDECVVHPRTLLIVYESPSPHHVHLALACVVLP
eukprot:m.161494 g.161494  ORF g.161494 m.161494 type:complete len:71 (-) comp14363_c1_seq8:199-411(-)